MSVLGRLFGKAPKPEKRERAVIENDLGSFTMEYLDKYNTQPAGAYIGYVRWNRQPESVETEAEVSCDGNDTLSADAGFERLRELLAGADKLENRMKAYIIKDMIDEDDGKIHTWGSCSDFGNGGQILSPGEFVRRLSVESIHIAEDGGVTFFIDLDDMYTDHALEVDMEPDGRFTACFLIG